MRRGLAAVLVCVLVLTAGCSALPGGGNGDGTDAPGAVDPSTAPGISDGQLQNQTALLDAHEAALTESGYSHDLSVNNTIRTDDGTYNSSERQRLQVSAGASEYLRQLVVEDQGRVVAWGNRSVEYQRVDTAGETRYREGSPANVSAMTARYALAPFLSAPFEVVETAVDDGRTFVVLEATGEPTDENAFPRGADALERYEARLVVDTEGRVAELTATADYESDGNPGSYEYEFQLRSPTNPGVERPEWVSEAAAAE